VLWDFVFYALAGAVITLAVRVAGIVIVFAFLIIPATISALFASGWRARLWIACGAGATASVLGLLFAYRLDFSMGPSVAAFLGVELVLAGAYAIHRSRALAVAEGSVLALVLVLLLAWGPATPARGAAALEVPAGPEGGHVAHHNHAHGPDAHDAHDDLAARIESAEDAGRMAVLYAEADDDGTRSDIVLKALALDRRVGGQLGLAFLRTDPPLFFRHAVVTALNGIAGDEARFDPGAPFTDPVNRKAARALAERLGIVAE
jgi:hypothetical protein